MWRDGLSSILFHSTLTITMGRLLESQKLGAQLILNYNYTVSHNDIVNLISISKKSNSKVCQALELFPI